MANKNGSQMRKNGKRKWGAIEKDSQRRMRNN